jgi:hypothetical protein
MSDVSSVLSLDSQTEKRGPLRLLIVDDDVVQRELLQRASRLAGCETVWRRPAPRPSVWFARCRSIA